MELQYKKITNENFTGFSLDRFVRHQVVTECWRMVNGEYRLVPCPFIDDWTAERKRENALEILGNELITYGAFDNGRVVGFASLKKQLYGNRMILNSFHVSEEYRRCGIGRRLFEAAVGEAKASGAEKLYISACSSKETISFYTAMGCAVTENVIAELAEDEPFDLQLECPL